MDIRQFRYFITVAETQNFTAAAKILFITQPTLSQQIAELERKIGVKLLIRDRHSVQLTPAGAALLTEAKGIVAKVDEAVRVVCQINAGVVGTITIGFLGAAERRFLPQLMAEFRKRYPEIDIDLQYFSSFTELDKAIVQGTVDIAITLKTVAERLPALNWQLLFTVPLSVIAPASHPFAGAASCQLSLLAEDSFLYVEQDRGLGHTLELCARRGIHPKVRLVPHIQSLLLSIEAGNGFSILPHPVPETYASPLLYYTNLGGDDSFLHVIAAWQTGNTNPVIPLLLGEFEALMPIQ
ncbi:LysR family transcriptional regulator [Sporomusa aerivorans]|uniref:LysR family transcriptional regulator n=1 Tax=Sporomusa aerivorans TaxID=204936 RepID=UPI00352B2D63